MNVGLDTVTYNVANLTNVTFVAGVAESLQIDESATAVPLASRWSGSSHVHLEL